jgi:arylsulfatase A-like enzyme
VANAVLKAKFGFGRGFQQYVHSRRTFNRPAEEVNDMAFRWLEEDSEKPFFLWIHYMDPHGPYTPPAPYSELFLEDSLIAAYPGNVEPGIHNYDLGKIPKYQWLTEASVPRSWRAKREDDTQSRMRERLHFMSVHGGTPILTDRWFYVAQYDAEIAYTDHSLRSVFQKLEDLNMLDNTLIVLTADHGESLGDHNYYFSHGWYLYDACGHVPLIFSFKGKLPAGIRVPNQVRSIDILPTVLDLGQIKTPPQLSGLSLLPLIESHQRSGLRSLWSKLRGDRLGRFDHLPAFSQTNTKNRLRSVRLQRWKLIQEFPYGEASEELYNLLEDPEETRNVLGKYPEISSTLRELLEYWHEGKDLAAETPLGLDRETEEALRSLGYIE